MSVWPVAAYWSPVQGEDGRVRCRLCPHGCVIGEGERGRCRARMCRDGELLAMGYGVVSSVHVDPIEKKPLYHYLPGAEVLSVGGWGCNMSCTWCQNWQISQSPPPYIGGEELLPAEVCALAQESGSPAVAHTYNEPLINMEYVQECARLCRASDIGTILVTNGYVCREPLAELLGDVSAVNLDIKSLSDRFYRTWCGTRVGPVLDTARQCREAGVHLEVTCLLIPGENSEASQVADLARWMSAELGREVPLHLSAFFPAWRMSLPPTTEPVMREAWEAARAFLDYVYVGNMQIDSGRHTCCPGCGTILIERMGYQARVTGIREGACASCGRPADVVVLGGGRSRWRDQ